MEFIWGIVAPDAKIFSGSGFRVDKTAEGLYTILFTNEFSVVPAVVATEIYPWPMDNSSHGGNTKDNAVVVFIGSDRVRIKVGNNDGSARDRAFSFIAVGT